MKAEAQMAKDLLEGRSSITCIVATYSIKFMMRSSTKKKDLKFFKTLFQYLTQRRHSSLSLFRRIYNFNFPSDGSNFIMMELRFSYSANCETAVDRWKMYKELIGE